MPDAHHFDDVAMRHGDSLTRFMEDAVDAADAGVDLPIPSVPVPVKRSHSAKQGIPRKVKPGSVTKRVRVWFSDEDYAGLMAYADRMDMVINDVVRIAVRDWMEAHRERGGHTRDATIAADEAGVPPGRVSAGPTAEVSPKGA